MNPLLTMLLNVLVAMAAKIIPVFATALEAWLQSVLPVAQDSALHALVSDQVKMVATQHAALAGDEMRAMVRTNVQDILKAHALDYSKEASAMSSFDLNQVIEAHVAAVKKTPVKA